ncbi:GNAT family N-acetyltransferase [Actinoplanes sp. NPDC020271]|uniref:GNAT family N-acetyltransferase n=1 Tax=Actinoplanes sp. NPDC020271 TaxID=3363896 RepID=UPI0037B9F57C
MTRTAPEITIRDAKPEDLATLVDTLAEGFHDGDFADWLIPDPAQRARVYPGYFRILAGHALNTGWVQITGDGDAVAVWHLIGPNPAVAPPIPRYQQRLADTVGPEALPRFRALDTAMEEYHPAGPHHYLAFLAVRPDRRGQGLGTALLEHHHQYLDGRGIPAYLEATGPRNMRLYLRHGYQPRPPFRLTDGSPHALPMWRDPNPGTTG